jgi:hypothetical protein
MDSTSRKIAQKWFVIGFISSFFFLIGLFGLYHFLNPTFEAPEEKSDFVLGNREGAEKIDDSVQLIEIKFGSGEIRIDYLEGSEINWNCDGVGKSTQLESDVAAGSVRLDFSSAIVDCDITIPPRALKIEGLHGDVEIRKVSAPVDVQLINGELFLQVRTDKKYRYQLSVESGEVDPSFENSDAPEAVLIKADLKYGVIETLD